MRRARAHFQVRSRKQKRNKNEFRLWVLCYWRFACAAFNFQLNRCYSCFLSIAYIWEIGDLIVHTGPASQPVLREVLAGSRPRDRVSERARGPVREQQERHRCKCNSVYRDVVILCFVWFCGSAFVNLRMFFFVPPSLSYCRLLAWSLAFSYSSHYFVCCFCFSTVQR